MVYFCTPRFNVLTPTDKVMSEHIEISDGNWNDV